MSDVLSTDERVSRLIELGKLCGVTIQPNKARVVLGNHWNVFTEEQLMKCAPELIAEASKPIAHVPYFTVQDPYMLDVLLRGDAWEADASKAREKGTLGERDADRAVVGGKEPVYLYLPHRWNTTEEPAEGVHADISDLRCEMSTTWDALYGKFLYVFSLPEDLAVATGHNSNHYVRVISHLLKHQLLAAYEILPFHWYMSRYCTQFVTADFRTHALHQMISCPDYDMLKYIIRPED